MGEGNMNDVDYRSTLECLRIAVRLIMPLDLDGFLERAEALADRETDAESRLSVRRLLRLARTMRDEGGTTQGAGPEH
jgi:hypothetical protein